MEKLVYLFLGISFGLNIYLILKLIKIRRNLSAANVMYNDIIRKLHEEAKSLAKDFTDVKQF